MAKINDGGPAFPNPEASQAHFGTPDGYLGMSKRDYFAAKVMQGFAADPSNHELYDDMDDMARNAYAAADAMLAARGEQ